MQCQQGWHNPTQTLLTKVNATVLDTVHFVTSSAFARFCAGSALTEVTNATASVKSDKASMIMGWGGAGESYAEKTKKDPFLIWGIWPT